MRFINTRRLKTNYEGIIGKTIRISQKVDNIGQTGMAVVNGTEWTEDPNRMTWILEPGNTGEGGQYIRSKVNCKNMRED